MSHVCRRGRRVNPTKSLWKIGLARVRHSEVVLVHGCGLLELVGEDEEHLEGVEGRERDAKDGDPTLEVLLDQADRLVVDAELEQSLARHEGVV